MKDSEYKILNLFKIESNKEFSTQEIVELIYPKTSEHISQVLSSELSDKEKLINAKRRKAQLHRRVLYHINKLVGEELLKVSKVVGKGEKHFSMNLGEGEEVFLEKDKRKIVIKKPGLPAMPIELYEQKGITLKFQQDSWANKVNSILIECEQYKNVKKLHNNVEDAFSNVNDCIALNNFESMIKKTDLEELSNVLKKIGWHSRDYTRRVSYLINLKNLVSNDYSKVTALLRKYVSIERGNTDFVFNIGGKDLQNHLQLLEEITGMFQKNKIKLFIKNNDLKQSPYMIGNAGVYTFSDKDWDLYEKEIQHKSLGISCGQCSVVIDFEKFFEEFKTAKEFMTLLKKIAKSLLTANSIQRRNYEQYLTKLVKFNNPKEKQFFNFSKNYIRFWNYDLTDPKKSKFFIDLLRNSKEEVDNFCFSEDIIYKSCGMATKFSIAFSSTFKDELDVLSKQAFKKVQINKLEDLFSEKIKEFIKTREEAFKIFDGGDRLRFYRAGEVNPEELCRELNILLNTYHLPFFCYDFGEVLQGDIKLTRFIN